MRKYPRIQILGGFFGENSQGDFSRKLIPRVFFQEKSLWSFLQGGFFCEGGLFWGLNSRGLTSGGFLGGSFPKGILLSGLFPGSFFQEAYCQGAFCQETFLRRAFC